VDGAIRDGGKNKPRAIRDGGKASRERSEAMDAKWTERFETAENASRERSEAMDAKWTERFETVERQNQATHAAVCALNGRFDDLYRHLLGAGAPPAQPGPAAG
jgi:hypothetical protein